MKYLEKAEAFSPYLCRIAIGSLGTKFPVGRGVVLADITEPGQFSRLETSLKLEKGTYRRVIVTPIDYTGVFHFNQIFGPDTNLDVTQEELLALQLKAADHVVEHADFSGLPATQKAFMLAFINQPQVYAWTIRMDKMA